MGNQSYMMRTQKKKLGFGFETNKKPNPKPNFQLGRTKSKILDFQTFLKIFDDPVRPNITRFNRFQGKKDSFDSSTVRSNRTREFSSEKIKKFEIS